MSRVQMADGLDAAIARRFVEPRVNDALDMLRDASARNAPSVRVWVTMRDERVRAAHVHADGQVVPDNLRFILDSADGVGNDLARHPRDPALPIANRINCRCDDPTLTFPLKDSIRRTQVTVTGTRVEGSVETRFPRAAESEFGTARDEAAHFMTNALREVATRMQSGQAR